MKEVQKRINPDATIFWGTSIDRTMNGKMRILVLLTGVKSPYTIADRADLISLGKRLGMSDEDIGIEAIS
jgi:cell division protein FtsZ